MRRASASSRARAFRNPLEELQLQTHRGERRAQLVRRVGDEGALALQRATEALEQIVERGDERPQLVREARFRQRAERPRPARREGVRKAGQRREPAADDDPDEEREQWQRHRHRRQHAQRAPRRAVAPQAHRLGDLDDLTLRVDAEDAPIAVRRCHGAHAHRGEHRRDDARARDEHDGAVGAPHLDEKVFRVDRRGAAALEDAVAECDPHLLELVIEELVRLLVSGAVDAECDQRAGDRRRGEQPHEQRAPDRAHARFATV